MVCTGGALLGKAFAFAGADFGAGFRAMAPTNDVDQASQLHQICFQHWKSTTRPDQLTDSFLLFAVGFVLLGLLFQILQSLSSDSSCHALCGFGGQDAL